MQVVISKDATEMGLAASDSGAQLLREAIERRGQANMIVATGASQFEVLRALTQDSRVDWSRVVGFHLDEYIGLSVEHPASFRKYLKERLVDQVTLKEFHYVNGEVDPEAECQRLGELIKGHPIDVAFIGIGENAHIAFNDPPADFETETPYSVVELDAACRRQQLGEGWFPTFDDIPRQAISMSVKQIMKSSAIMCSVPDSRKAQAVRACVEGPVSPDVPASILQNHPHVTLFLDTTAAELLRSD